MAHLTRSLAFIMFHTRIHRPSARPWPLSLHLPWLLGAMAMGAGLAQVVWEYFHPQADGPERDEPADAASNGENDVSLELAG